MDRISGRHGRKREIEPFAEPRRHQARRKQKRRFGLARSGRVFDEEQLRPRAERQLPRMALHRARRSRCAWRDPFESGRGCAAQRCEALGAERASRRRQSLSPVIRQRRFDRSGAEKIRVRSDPVRESDEAGEPPGEQGRVVRVQPGGGPRAGQALQSIESELCSDQASLVEPFCFAQRVLCRGVVVLLRRWTTVMSGHCGAERGLAAAQIRK